MDAPKRVARRTWRTALASAISAVLVAAAVLVVPVAASAAEVPATLPPLLQPDDSVVTADPLPTVQIDSGYVWAQTTIGNTVYAGGSFSNARAALAAPGTNLTPRSNILAFDITTGALSPFAPQVNGTIRSIAASADGARIYIGGSFNQVNGQPRWNFAALDAQTGQLVAGFSPSIGGTGVYGITVSADTVYLAGLFTQANGVARKNLAAFATSNGALRPWAPTTDLQADAIVIEPGGAHIVAAGRFYRVNDVVQRGLVALDPTTAAIDTGWLAPQTVVNGWATGSDAGKAGIFTLTTDSSGVYGTGWVFANATVGNLEGVFAAEAGSGEIRWISDCHGDHYGVYSTGDTVYATSHTHACETVSLWPEQNPRSYRYMEAYTATAEGTLTRSASAGGLYKDWSGTPAPSAYAWYPDFTVGTASGLGQAGLSITGAGDFIAVAGEFTSVNNQRYQGIVRFSTNPSTGAKQGPQKSQSAWGAPVASTSAPGRVGVNIPINWDRDDRDLTYELLRAGTAEAVDSRVVPSGWWTTGNLVLNDSGLTAGQSHSYSVRVVDSDGNSVTSSSVTATVSSGQSSPYADGVLDDGAALYYPLGTIMADWAGSNPPSAAGGTSAKTPGAVPGATGLTATSFSGSSDGRVVSSSSAGASNVFSTEAWFQTTTNRGGKILGFGSSKTGSSSQYDRHAYMQNNGRLTFGVYPSTVKTVSSTQSYNDGQWHHVVATEGTGGIALYVDGQLIQRDASVTGGDLYTGYWRIGGDNLSGWPNQPTSQYFAGVIDEVAVYPTELSAGQVAEHYATGKDMVAPTAQFETSVEDLAVAFDASDSSASGNATIASYAWDFGDGETATGETPTHTYAAAGTYAVTLTVADSNGLHGAVTSTVDVAAANQLPTADFTAAATGMTAAVNAATSSDPDGEIADFSWNWGDGGADGSGATASHTYAEPGTYTVTLTVTDDRGGQSTTTQEVAVTHADPIADFTASAALMEVSVDATASSASDAATLAYAWNWGDGSAVGSGATATHTYAQAGTFTVTLTVTDSIGASAQTTRDVTVADVAYAVRDDFERTGASGWGAAEIGGTYAAMYGSAAAGSVSNGKGILTLPAGQTRNMSLQETPLADSVTTVTYSLGQQPATGNSYIGVSARQSSTADYLTRVWMRSNGSLWLVLQRSGTVLASQPLNVTWAAGDEFILKVQVAGSSPTTIEAKTWKSSAAEPSEWQVSATDATAGLQDTGWVSIHAARSGPATTPGVFSFDGLRVLDASATTEPENVAPTAAFAAVVSDLEVAVDGNTSADSDGSVASYEWDWGDGAAEGSGVTSSHVYTEPGTYSVTLTVTDDEGATGTITQDVSVVAAGGGNPENVEPTAAFTVDRTGLSLAVDGSTSSDPEGPIASYTWSWGDGKPDAEGASSEHTYAAAGTYQVTLTVTDSTGATGTITQEAIVNEFLAADSFERTATGGWGAADSGGAWSVLSGSASVASVADGQGRVTLAPGSTRNIFLSAVAAQDVVVSADFSLSSAPSEGSTYVGLVARSAGADNYTVRSWMHTNGSVWIVIQRGSTVLKTYIVPGITRSAGDSFTLKVQVGGGASTTIDAKLWRMGSAEPAGWQVSSTDASGLSAPGAVGVHMSRSGAASTPGIMSVDNFQTVGLD